jgi:hypothetical protein
MEKENLRGKNYDEEATQYLLVKISIYDWVGDLMMKEIPNWEERVRLAARNEVINCLTEAHKKDSLQKLSTKS